MYAIFTVPSGAIAVFTQSALPLDIQAFHTSVRVCPSRFLTVALIQIFLSIYQTYIFQSLSKLSQFSDIYANQFEIFTHQTFSRVVPFRLDTVIQDQFKLSLYAI